ncbi:MAG: flagellar basal body-associated FliL family protein [Alphaproteobacteria bacterium]|nr:flagellar basal body-associated FliL family protein [Alphaproteobacteria bacterium]
MIKIIAIVLQVVAVAGGVALGLSLRSPNADASAVEDSSHETEAASEESHGADKKAEKSKSEKKEKKKKKKKKKKSGSGHEKPKSGHDGGGSASDGSSYMKFSRQFIVPVIRHNGVGSLVALDINLELSASADENVYLQEPKLRDAMLSALLRLSNEGAFNAKLLQPENMEEIRDSLFTSAQSILGEDVTGVLILNMARQDL